MLTAKQHELLLFIHDRLAETGVSPSFEEMKDALDLKSKSGVHRLIGALEERHFLRRLPNRARALEVVRLPDDAVPGRGDRAGFGQMGAGRIGPERTGAGRTGAGQAGAGRGIPAGSRGAGAPVADLAAARARRDAMPEGLARQVPFVGRIAAGLPIEAVEVVEQLAVPATLLGPGEHYALQVVGDSMIEAGIFDGDFALIRRADDARDGEIVVALVDNSEATLKYFRREKGMVRLDPANSLYQPQRYLPSRVKVQGKLAGLLRRY